MVDIRVVLQVAIGLVVVFCVYRMSLWIMKQDALVDTGRSKSADPVHAVKIVDGYAPTGLAANRTWNTLSPDARAFASLKRSYNRKGGAQFTYVFWLKLDDTTDANVAGKDILVRGDTTPYLYKRIDHVDEGGAAPKEQPPREINGALVKCPRIRFGDTFDSFVVELNTVDDPDLRFSIDPYAAGGGDDSLRHNMIKLTPGKWTMYAFTFEDNVAINDFEDGIVMRFFVNDVLYQTFRAKSALRQNYGNVTLLHTGPGQTPVANGRIGDVIHYNYAISAATVRELFNVGPPTKLASDISGDDSRGEPLYLSEFNKLDVYNA